MFSHVCLSVCSTGGGVPCDLPMMHWGSSVYKGLYQARPISWCLDSKEVRSRGSWEGHMGPPQRRERCQLVSGEQHQVYFGIWPGYPLEVNMEVDPPPRSEHGCGTPPEVNTEVDCLGTNNGDLCCMVRVQPLLWSVLGTGTSKYKYRGMYKCGA